MKRTKISYIVCLLLFIMILLMICSNNDKLDLELKGYGFYQDVDDKTSNFYIKQVEVIINAYINDSNINNDRIEISYDGIRIIENILLLNKKDGLWTGKIVHYDNSNANDEIIGDIILFNKGKECFISLYNEKLFIIAPVGDKEKAIQKYLDYIMSSGYNLK